MLFYWLDCCKYVMNIAYIRLGTEDQSTARQHADFKAAGIKLDKVFEEKMSGKNAERPALKEMITYVREDDILYIEYVASFERCDREKDYEVAWKFFEEKYSK